MVLFCAAIRRDSVSLLNSLFHNYAQIFSYEIIITSLLVNFFLPALLVVFHWSLRGRKFP